mmetsp:Transcript_9764/g.20848  ORF Transcript_9764/g.20848 Transcript_9764/m.20848 type:complete len:235 (-) Transcript_9764:113-817(-)
MAPHLEGGEAGVVNVVVDDGADRLLLDPEAALAAVVDGVAVEGGRALAPRHHGRVRRAADVVAAEHPPGVAARDDAEAFDVVDLTLVKVRVGAAHDLDGEVLALCNVAAPKDWLRCIVGGGRHHQHTASGTRNMALFHGNGPVLYNDARETVGLHFFWQNKDQLQAFEQSTPRAKFQHSIHRPADNADNTIRNHLNVVDVHNDGRLLIHPGQNPNACVRLDHCQCVRQTVEIAR